MRNDDSIEYYNIDGTLGLNLVATVKSSIVPALGSKINIREKTWEVVNVTYAVDDADNSLITKMRAIVNLRVG